MNIYLKTIAITLLFLLTSCKSLEQFVKNAVAKPTVNYESFSIGSDASGNIIFKPVFQVTNKNAYSVPIDNFSYQLSFNGSNMLDGTSSHIGNLPAYGKRSVELDIPLNSEVLEAFKALFINNKTLDYAVRGDVSVLGFKLPFEKADTLHRPSFSLGSMDLKNASFSEVNLGLKLLIDNPNKFTIPLQTLSYSVRTKQQNLFSGKIDNAQITSGSNTIEIPLTLHQNQLFGNVLSLLQNPNLPLVIDVDSGIYRNTINYNLNLKSIL